jgi:hypothetical protein
MILYKNVYCVWLLYLLFMKDIRNSSHKSCYCFAKLDFCDVKTGNERNVLISTEINKNFSIC